ncbi:hypothetical protein CHLRE_02g105200v5 [Chlamydomonas reinhardtii]|uniref:Saposin B-type domain-containing protein n=1 Tax=Chlamydomonas reinhardtii TaxID=3055 RepID=A8I478_CHLRE|nr:uncharacterized protein CHLRE_02g105200v5 [Chlamydomonas reinhardtii]PNW87014.1 hypothetical protein CHLRE_02g105200v5 [Chlamydomonas reinhardtii]|eukprot:XP_001699982.1 predicted protein [Chlamydomonas reinhardtii]
MPPLKPVLLALVGLFALVNARGSPLVTPPVGDAGDACQTCLLVVRIVEDLLCDPAATEFLVDLVEKQVCPAMGDSAQCHNLAEGLLPTVIQWLRASATPASLCGGAGVCGAVLAQVPELNKPSLVVRDSTQCSLCKYVVTLVREAVNSTATLEKIEQAALQACSALPAELASTCTDFVNTYAPMIAQLIESMDADTVCGLAGVCMEAAAAVPPPALPASLVRILAGVKSLHRPPPPHMMLVLAALGVPPPKSMPGMMGGPGGPDGHVHGPGGHMHGRDMQQMGPGSGPIMPFGGPPPHFCLAGALNDACDYCKMAVIEAHSLVSNPTVQAEVVNYTLAVCEQFPSFTTACKSYVAMYAPLVFTLLEQYLVPDTLCAQTGMCPPPPGSAAPALLPWTKLDKATMDKFTSLQKASAAAALQPPTPPHSWGCWFHDVMRNVYNFFARLTGGAADQLPREQQPQMA